MHHEHDIQHAVSDFEAQKLCYLPLTAFYLKPYQRLLHYQLLLESMTSHCQCIVFAVYDLVCLAFIFLGYLFLQAMKYKKGKGSPYSITERKVPALIPVLGSQPAGDASHKLGGRLPLLSATPAVTPTPLKGLLPIWLLGEQRHSGCEQFA